MSRFGIKALALVAGALCVGGALWAVRDRLRPAPEPQLDPRVEEVFSLAPGTTWRLDLARDDDPQPVPLRFRVVGWEWFAGKPHARVQGVVLGAERVFSVEWLRVETAGERVRVVCSGRRIASAVHVLDPPQPLFEVPLEGGRTWTWSGRVDGTPVRVDASTTARDDPRFGAVVEVLHRVVVMAETGERRGDRALVFAPGRGLVEERWHDPAGTPDHLATAPPDRAP